ncbi:hypothetical protein [Phenylobacterium sp.]|uniref:hypothetical protein n=1 Tax=Phenylobacterium sp. TaxID=1871053 RepID=UPI003568578C
MTWAVVASTIAHLAVAVVVLLQRPTLSMLVQERGPPEAIIPILILPHTPPPAAGRLAQPAPIRLHRRPQRFVPPDVTPAPIAPPTPPAPAPAAPRPGPVVIHPAPQPEGPKGDVRTALRQGAPGCSNPDAVGLTKAERDLCNEKFGKGAKSAPFLGLGLAGDKQRLLDAAAQKKDDDYRYKRGTVPSGLGKEDRPGQTAEDMGANLGNDRPAAKVTIPN